MDVTFMCQWYPPEPVEIPRSIALSLADRGLDVNVLTGVPNYPNGVVAEGYRASRASTEWLDGLRVQRAPLYPSHDSSAVRRVANYVSWAASAAVSGQRRLRKSDAVLVYSSPATAALPAMVARRLWGTPYVLLVQDVWPDSIFASGFLPGRAGRLAKALVGRFVDRAYADADHVAVISPGMVDLLVSRGVPRDKVSLVHNWVPEEDAPHSSADPVGSTPLDALGLPEGSVVFLYAGNHGHAQALEAVVDGFAGHVRSQAHLVLLGDGVAKPALRARSDGASNVHFLDPVDRATAQRVLLASDVSVVSLADAPLFSVTMPSKVQSGLATARPMLVVAQGDAARVVEDADAGVAATPGDPASVGRAADLLAARTAAERRAMGDNGRRAYFTTMARDVGAGRLRDLLVTAAERRSRGARRPLSSLGRTTS